MENNSQPATKADVQDLRTLIERVETSLLTEFHKLAQTYEVRARGTIQVVHNFEERLMLAAERISSLERKIR
jgi:hypothetical protein